MSDMTVTGSGAEGFFDNLVAKGDTAFAFLESFAKSGTDENEWRDFKEAGWYDAPVPTGATAADEKQARDAKLKSTWSECIGAFANSGGGVLIWGVKAPNRKAIKASIASDARSLAERLQQLVNDAVDPPAAGIRIVAITKNPDDPAGFVICYVPASKFGPHASRWAKHDHYFAFRTAIFVLLQQCCADCFIQFHCRSWCQSSERQSTRPTAANFGPKFR